MQKGVSSILKLVAAEFSEMLVPLYQTMWPDIPEDHNLHVHHHDSIIPHM
jgi:hypothetical protein